MPITKFKITTKPERATIAISTIPYVLNKEYSIAQQSQMNVDITGKGVPYDKFGFKLGNDNNIWSEEQFCTINAEVDSGSPVLSNINLDIKLNEITDLTSSFNFDTNTDRIKFNSFSSPKYGSLKINGVNVELSKTYFIYEFVNITWVSSYSGISQNVLDTISFNVGNKNAWSPDYDLELQSTANMQVIIDSDPSEMIIAVTG